MFLLFANANPSNGLALAEEYNAGEYRLQTGDVIGFAVIGYPEMQKRAVIDQSGVIVLPALGPLNVLGKTIEDVRKEVIEVLKPKSLPQRSADGTETWTGFYPDQIVVDIEEYRPVYIDGDIAAPGIQPFRPGMTVRQAVAAGGGYQLGRGELQNPEMTAADLGGRLHILRIRYQESEIKAARIEAQLSGARAIELPDTERDPSLEPRREEALQQEGKHLEAVYADQEKERASIKLAATKAAERMGYLKEQQKADQAGAAADAAELVRLKKLFEKGLIQITSVNNAQRAVLLSATRALQTNAEIAQLERDQGDLQRSLDKFIDQGRIDLLADLQTERAAMNQMRAEMDSLTKQIAYVMQMRSDLVGEGDRITIGVTRSTDGQAATTEATEDTLLAPGDTITITLEVPPGAAVAN
ncbi:polysaccharide biosynthesis/export family protein [Mesorhizobium muleiense]|uniref:Polysaccharide export outer membrane protein n=1 Tax=Mesorhizobium muleiense TaxID=1004279 RepID=A0A1G8I1B3_9HYPH|nr:polysaccharide biosynthesis/export family protein [Mesorhizobium muleiense]MCF6099540.1 polysaccharide biosynthesis/export family protein [Mesorhizobium muleiense]SDI12709.1 polysaccharide export outer membrane protein [Mesorhizobium muleiense]